MRCRISSQRADRYIYDTLFPNHSTKTGQIRVVASVRGQQDGSKPRRPRSGADQCSRIEDCTALIQNQKIKTQRAASVIALHRKDAFCFIELNFDGWDEQSVRDASW